VIVRKCACLFKVKFWSSVTPNSLMVSENGMGITAIVVDVTGEKVHRRWRVPIRIFRLTDLGDMLRVDGDADAAVENRIRIGWNKL